MNYFSYLRQKILEILLKLEKDEVIPKGLDHSHITVEFPRDPKHGDLSTNAAMVLAKPAKLKPSDLAGLIIEHLTLLPEVNDADAAGPGFINIRLSSNFWWDRLREIVADGTNYGNSDIGRGVPVNIEYVSANPTGPLHVGHARGAVIGDALASILSKAGYNVT
ncbi:MAG: arginine--tRNA ligase, partial [SAR202 cluster bacterium]|nr:arginine--tRNA ligase [SAR202 cluster bacterium]